MSRLHLHAWGPDDGTPLLVVHGVSNTGARYRRLAQDQLPGARVVAPDLRGHGRSTWDPPWSVPANVADLAAVVEAWGRGPVAVAGHSFGGLIGMALAAARPELVERLALIDPAAAIAPAVAAARAEGFRRDEGWASPEEARAARLAMRPEGARQTVDEDLATFLDECEDGRWRFRFSRSAAVTAWSEMAGPAPSLAAWPGRALLIAATGPDAMVTEALRARLRAEGFRRDEGWASPEEARAARLAMRPEGARETVDEDLATFLDECEDGRWRFRFSRSAAVTAWSEMAGPAPSLAAWPGRALLIAATGPDGMVTEALRARLRADLGDRLHEEAIDAGHMLFWDAPRELGRLLRGFLA